jgi:flagellar hook-basal body complex protein FliE
LSKEKVKEKKNIEITDDMILGLQRQVEDAQIMMLKAQGALEVLMQLKEKE